MSLLTGLFNLLALLYIGRAAQLAIQVARNWKELRQEPLTGHKQRLAEQAAFFLGVPPAVLIHELSHAVAVILFGGRVVEFGYRVFWGYVVPQGVFTAAEDWIIAIAGTLGSLAFGAAVWAALRRYPSRTVQYFGLRTFRFQIYFSLLYYPIFSLFLPIGDWRIIYNFQATPILSTATAVIHGLALLLFWRADRAGRFEMVAFDSMEKQALYDSAAVRAGLGDPAARLETISLARFGGAPRQARRSLDEFLAQYPNAAEGHLQLALLLLDEGRGHTSRDAVEAAGKALALGLSDPDHIALARQIAATHYLERGDGRAAEAELNAALNVAPGYDPGLLDPRRRAALHRLRSQAYRRQERYDEAYAEIEAAIRLAEEAGMDAAVRQYQDEKELIEKHSGHKLSSSAET
jgi:tetratricopeptide (TPR) repeat protein